jgi:hypothetical protein
MPRDTFGFLHTAEVHWFETSIAHSKPQVSGLASSSPRHVVIAHPRIASRLTRALGFARTQSVDSSAFLNAIGRAGPSSLPARVSVPFGARCLIGRQRRLSIRLTPRRTDADTRGAAASPLAEVMARGTVSTLAFPPAVKNPVKNLHDTGWTGQRQPDRKPQVNALRSTGRTPLIALTRKGSEVQILYRPPRTCSQAAAR